MAGAPVRLERALTPLESARARFQALDAEMRAAVIDGKKWPRGKWREMRAARAQLEKLRRAVRARTEIVVDARGRL